MQTHQASPSFSSPTAAEGAASARAILPILVFMGYLAFLISGFGASLGAYQPLPLYLFLAMLLLTLQEVVAPQRSHSRFIFSVAASAFALLFALDAVYRPLGAYSFTRSPWTYLLLNVILVATYVVLAAGLSRRLSPGHGSLSGYGRLAADFAGGALLFFVLAFFADLAGNNAVLRALGVHPWPPLAPVSLGALFHSSGNGPVDSLPTLDLVLGLICAAIALGFLVVVGALLSSGSQSGDATATQRTLRSILADIGVSMNESLSVALTPFIWLVPAFSVAYLAHVTTDFLNQSAESHISALQLFNPLSPASVANIPQGLQTILVIAIAVASAVLAVAVAERDGEVLRHTLRVIAASARTLLLIGGIFILSLALINTVVILLRVSPATPFQVGAPGFILLLAGGGLLYYESARAARVGAVAPSPITRQVGERV